MLQSKVTFHNTPHSDAIENHALTKLNKFLQDLKINQYQTPLHGEYWIKVNDKFPHQRVELHIKTPEFDIHTHEDGEDVYQLIDITLDKMKTLITKEKSKKRDKQRNQDTPKRQFNK